MHANVARHLPLLISCLLASATVTQGAELKYAKDGSGVCGYTDTPVLPWCGFHVHDPDRPVPPRITPGQPSTQAAVGSAPSDAVVLFNGKDLSAWKPTQWKVENGYIEATEGELATKEDFGNIQVHVEWMTPDPPQGEMFNRGNNGVYLMGLYEIQIFDSYNEKLYPDGQAASIYGQTPPLVNACLKPGQWQAYDIIFFAPVFEGDKLVKPARVTIFHNGLLVQHNEEIHGETGHRILPEYKHKVSQGPLVLSGHHNPVRFRNLWLRKL
jgi:hypothetical protein